MAQKHVRAPRKHRTSENSVKAKFAVFHFHALRCILSHSNNPRRVRRGYANERGNLAHTLAVR
jgi:hypothetical protein